MAYQVLARKWRPKSFATLVGQEHVVKALTNALENQRLHHAYLLTGTRGVGKTTIARLLAKSLNCETGVTARPCGECAACRQIDGGRFVDLLEIDAASNTGIDNIREVLDNAQYAPTQGRFKVYIIDEVHMLSKSAFNAMLKTLEEPPGHVKFILATTDPQKVPVTILSRCLQFALRQMLPQQVCEHLQRVLEAESIPYEAAALPLLGHAASGSMRDALSLLDQAIAYGNGQVEEAGVRAMLGAVDQSYLFELLQRLAERDGSGLIAVAEQLASRGVGADAALHELAALLHRIALRQTVPASLAPEHPHYAALVALAENFTAEDIQLYYQIALHGRRDLALAPDEFAGLSMTLLRMLAFAPAGTTIAMPAAAASPAPRPTPSPAPAESPASPATAPWENPTPVPAAPVSPVPAPSSEPLNDPASEALSGSDLPPWEAPHPVEAPAPTPFVYDGDWPALTSRLGGVARMLAEQAACEAYADGHFQLALPIEQKAVAGPHYRAKLEEELSRQLDLNVRVEIKLVENADATPVLIAQRERQVRQAAAEAAINADPFVQTLITEFGATIVPASIKPI
ncbi:DNA polymerase III subunit gamma/tau [Chitinimonas lacunae]|uniref:DNA polymerase III subunit gamma/tau n=1 Tax=Chitinimonas lacunae TaxID=1963018 RepID=A0ABV8MPW3_9NEIS